MDKLIAQYPAVAWLLLAAAVVTAFGVLWRKAIRPVWRRARAFFRAIAKFLDNWFGTPAEDGQPARPGVVDRLDAIDKRLRTVEHELQPNSGASLRDAMDRVEAIVTPDDTTGG